MLLPYQVDVPIYRWPITNILIIALNCLSFAGMYHYQEAIEVFQSFVLHGWNVQGLLGHMWLHLNLFHLIGNMIFLWVFGNAICAKTGNFLYAVIYTTVGLFSAVIHNFADGAPAIGASGAINGIVGMFLILYPRNDIYCAYFLLYRFGTFSLSSFWMILLWLAFDIWGVASGEGGVAYWAHIGGFVSGMIIAALLLKLGVIRMTQTESSLFDAMS